MAEKIALEIDIDAKGSVKSLGQLEQEAERLNEELRKVPLGSQAFKELKQELIGVNKEIKNTELSMEALDNEQVASELGSVAGAVGDVSAAFILLGGGDGAIEQTIQNIEKAIGVSMAFKGAIEGVASGRKLLNNVIKNSTSLQKANNAINVLAGTIMKAFGGSVDTTSIAFKGLRAAIIATGIGALVVGIGLLVANFDKLSDMINNTTKSQRMYNDAAKQAIDNIGEELSASNKLQKTLNDETITREDKVKAVKDLQDEYPDLLSNIDAEKTSIEDINKALILNTKLIRLKAQLDAIQSIRAEEYKKILKAQVDAQTGANVGIEDQIFILGNSIQTFFGVESAIEGVENAQDLANLKTLDSIKESENQIVVLDKLEQQIESQIKALEELGATDGKMSEEDKKKLQDKLKRLQEEKKAFEDAQKAFKEWLLSQENATRQRLENIKAVGLESIKARDFFKELAKEIAAEEEEEPIIEDLQASEKAAKLKSELKIRAISDEIEQERQLRLQQLEWDKETQLQELQLSGELTNDLRLAIESDYARQKVEINEEANKKILLNQQALEAAKINLAINGIGALMNLTSAFAKDNEKSQRRAFEINKKLQIAQAIMQTYQGANAIFASAAANPSTILFPAQPFITAGIAIANGLANVVQISKQQFQSSQPGSGDLATPSFQSGGAAPALQPANTSLLVPQQQNQVYVTETDITNVQNQVAVIQGMGGFG
jgi:hypothetical protein